MAIKIVGFDLDDTLYERSELYRKVYNVMQNSIIKLDVLYEDFYIMFQIKSEYEYRQFIKHGKKRDDFKNDRIISTYKFFGVELTLDQAVIFNSLYYYFREKIDLRENAKDLMQFFKDKKIPMFVLTNGVKRDQINKLIQLGVEDFIPQKNWFISEEIGKTKPDDNVFQYIEDKIGFSKDEIMYIGDDFKNDIVGPTKNGWNAIYFRPLYGEEYRYNGPTIQSFDEVYQYIK